MAGRLETSYSLLPAHSARSLGGTPSTAALCPRKGGWFLPVVLSLPTPQAPAGPEVVGGVELGLAHPALTATKQFLGERRWCEQEPRDFQLRRALQAKGTHALAKRHLQPLSGKPFRQRPDPAQVLAKRFVRSVEPGTTLAREHLR